MIINRFPGVGPNTRVAVLDADGVWELKEARNIEANREYLWTPMGPARARRVERYEPIDMVRVTLPRHQVAHTTDHPEILLSPGTLVMKWPGGETNWARLTELTSRAWVVAAVEGSHVEGLNRDEVAVDFNSRRPYSAVAFELPGEAGFYANGILVRTPT